MKECGTPQRAARRQPFERREALAELEAGGAVVGVVARDAAIDQQAAQGDDEGLQAQPRDEEAVDRAQDARRPARR